jgi:cellulose synthase/poly-beta-1,6-N-acetylglucosamine synthase-like glycosyltransferase
MDVIIKTIIYIVYFITLYLSIFFLTSFLIEQDKIKKDEKKQKLTKFPTVSIIVPAYNEEKGVRKTVNSIFNQKYPNDKITIYLIDDGSTDNTFESMQQLAKKNDFNVIVIKQKINKGKAAAMNVALKQVKTTYFACLDADSEINASALYESMAVFESRKKEGVAIVTPVMGVDSPKKVIEWMQKIEYATTMFLVRILSYIDCNYVAPGPFSIYRSDIIKKIGGFSEDTITEDQDIAYAIQKEHFKIVQSPHTKVITRVPNTVKSLYKQRNRWFKGSLQCIRKYKHVILNKEYGDFGLFQMPFNIFLFSLSTISISLFFYYIIKPIVEALQKLHQIGYDIMPYLRDMRFTFDILALNWDSIIMSIVLIGAGFVVLYISHREQKDSIRNYNILLFIPYFVIYYLSLSFVATIALYEFFRNKVQKW